MQAESEGSCDLCDAFLNFRGEYEDFVTGFVTPEGKVWGRPVGITVAKDGSLLISEDGDKTIWRVSYGR